MRLLILGNGAPVVLLIKSLQNSDVNIVGVVQDKVLEKSKQSDFLKELKFYGIPLLEDDKNPVEFDLIFVINYNKIIDLGKYRNTKIINLHMGLLPKYRGNNANAWAVMNGENSVGYTLHEVEDLLDAGDIYYKFEYNISQDTSYLPAKLAIEADIVKNIEKEIFNIYQKKSVPQSQAHSEFIYCSKLRKSDGLIQDWNQPSDLFIRKQFVFGKPLGTGLHFLYQNKKYEIGAINLINNYAQSIGVPGAVVYIENNALWIKTNDTAIRLSNITVDENEIEVNTIFKIGNRL